MIQLKHFKSPKKPFPPSVEMCCEGRPGGPGGGGQRRRTVNCNAPSLLLAANLSLPVSPDLFYRYFSGISFLLLLIKEKA